LRELGSPFLEDALACLDLLAEVKPEKLERAAVRLCAGERPSVDVLPRLRRRVRPGLARLA
jgi:hypothetical protein